MRGTQVTGVCTSNRDRGLDKGKLRKPAKTNAAGGLSSKMLATRPGCPPEADDRFGSDKTASKNKEGNKIICMIGFPCVKHKSGVGVWASG